MSHVFTHVLGRSFIHPQIILMNNKTFVHQQQVFICEIKDKAARLQMNETSASPNSIKSRINEKERSCQTGAPLHFPQVNASSDKL